MTGFQRCPRHLERTLWEIYSSATFTKSAGYWDLDQCETFQQLKINMSVCLPRTLDGLLDYCLADASMDRKYFLSNFCV